MAEERIIKISWVNNALYNTDCQWCGKEIRLRNRYAVLTTDTGSSLHHRVACAYCATGMEGE